MKKVFLLIFALLLASVLLSCENSKKKKEQKQESLIEEVTENEDVVKTSMTDQNGVTLEMVFDNLNNTALLMFEGDTIRLVSQKPASGIWYSNDTYELRGKGDNVELFKNGDLVFQHVEKTE
ncbi:MAG: MliC family protein [Lentimicrobiaceae bacterium]|nr:MliC family protein [Lentimicrobiaceae bacterium]